MSQNPSHEETLFAAALALPAAEHAAYLDNACGDNSALRRAVEGLLAAHEAASFMAAPTAGQLAGTVQAAPRPMEAAGTLIGRYKLLQKIGEGGCGTVYMAEQEEPVRRRVALKVIKLGMDTKEVIARFEAERQALAMMDHPNIAKVLDGGATEAGRPFFVMELVRGIPITKYCDEHNLATAERLELFTQVCHAVQHAHQKGIIHRDIKPSNILVTVNDGMAVPKVIDFGIAKATQGRLTDRTLFTAFEQFIGTPAYMSPEQAEMSSLDIDTRSDIYTLGVLLYELLTGRTPFEAKELMQAGLDEMRRQIREVEPPRPSTRLRTLEQATLTTTAQHRRTDAPKLIKLVDGDLDWIVMRCLEKDRTRRYETANGLADDIGRHLGNEPVAARPPSTFYRLQKTIRRNRLAFGAAAAVAFALAIGIVVSTTAYLREKAAHEFAVRAALAQRAADESSQSARGKIVDVRREAQAIEKKAKIEETRTAYTLPLLRDIFNSGASGSEKLRQLLDQTADRLSLDSAMPPEARHELCGTLGDAYMALGEFGRAETLFREMLVLRRKLFGPLHKDTVAALNKLVDALKRQGKTVEVESEMNDAQVLRLRFLKDRNFAAAPLANLARELRRQGKYAEAEASYWEAIEIYETKGNQRQQWGKVLWLGDIALVRFEAGDLAGAKDLAREWLQVEKETRTWSLAVATSFGTVNHNLIFDANSLLGRIALREGDRAAAKAYLLKAGDRSGGAHRLGDADLNYSLAAELLGAGEREVVLEFLDLVREFYVAGWETGAANRHRDQTTYESEAKGREHSVTLEQWRKDVSAGRVPEAWTKQFRSVPQVATNVGLQPLPNRSARSPLVREIRSVLMQVEYPLGLQVLGWVLAVPILRRQSSVSGKLSRRLTAWLSALGAVGMVEATLAIALLAGAGFRFEFLGFGLRFCVFIGWLVMWEVVRALRAESTPARGTGTILLRVSLAYLVIYFGVIAMLTPRPVAPDYVYALGVLATPLMGLIPLVVGFGVTWELWRWTRRNSTSAPQATRLLFLAAPILGLQAVTSSWDILTVIHIFSAPLAFSFLWVSALLPWLIAGGFSALRKPLADAIGTP